MMRFGFLFLFVLFFHACISQIVLPNMPAPNHNVWAIQKVGNMVYIGGAFDSVGGVPRSHLASFDASTGLLSNWNPGVNNTVYSLAIAGGKLIAGGAFDTVSSQLRGGICMFNLSTGNLTNWTANQYSPWLVLALAVNGNTFYFSGSTGSGSGFSRLYGVDAVSGGFTGFQSDSMAGDIRAICPFGNYIYAGGQYLYRYDLNTGLQDTAWHPELLVNGSGGAFVNAMTSIGRNIYIGGSYTSVDGQNRSGICAFDTSGTMTAFNIASSSQQVWSLFPDGDYIWIGGNSNSYGGQMRYRMAQFNIADQSVTCWNPSVFSYYWSFVNAIYVASDTVYAASGYPANANDYLKVSHFPNMNYPAVTIQANGAVDICSGGRVELEASRVSGYNYQWNLNGTPISGATGSVYYASAAGEYSCFVHTNCYTILSNSITVTVSAASYTAVINATGPPYICQGSNVLLQATPVGASYTFQWLNDNAFIAGANVSSYNALQAGNYSCIVSDGTCSIVTNSIHVYYFGFDSLVLQPGSSEGKDAYTAGGFSSYVPLLNNSLNFDGSPDFLIGALQTIGFMQGLISFDLRGIIPNAYVQQAVLALYNNPNSTVNNGNSNAFSITHVKKLTSYWEEDLVTYNNPPTASALNVISVPYDPFPHANLNIDVSLFAQEMVSNPDSNFGFQVMPSVAYWGYAYIFASSDNADSTIRPKLTIYGYDSTTHIVAMSNTVFCNGGNVTLQVLSSGTGLTYQWLKNNQSVAGATSLTFVASSTGNYSCLVSNGTCTKETNTIVVTSNPDIQITSSDSTDFCQGDSVVLSASPQGTFLWSYYRYKQQHYCLYHRDLFSNRYRFNGCVATSLPVLVNVSPIPAVTFTGLADTVCADAALISLTGNPSGGNFYGSGISGNVFDPVSAGPGLHAISYTYAVLNCPATYTDSILVDTCLIAAMPELFTDNFNATIYPNPFSDHFEVNFSSLKQYPFLISVFDCTGRELEKRILHSSASVFRVDKTVMSGSGVYFVRIEQNGFSKMLKAIRID